MTKYRRNSLKSGKIFFPGAPVNHNAALLADYVAGWAAFIYPRDGFGNTDKAIANSKKNVKKNDRSPH